MMHKYIARGQSFVMRVPIRACGVHTVTTSGGALQGLKIPKRRCKGSSARKILAAFTLVRILFFFSRIISIVLA
jgi:hypothetical protein